MEDLKVELINFVNAHKGNRKTLITQEVCVKNDSLGYFFVKFCQKMRKTHKKMPKTAENLCMSEKKCNFARKENYML